MFVPEPVKDIVVIVVIYDARGIPIDTFLRISWRACCLSRGSPYGDPYDIATHGDIIPGGLAKRVKGEVDGSVQELTTPFGSKIPRTRVEFRILDFRIVREE